MSRRARAMATPPPASRHGAGWLADDERGVSAAEFAFVAPVLVLLCLAIMQFGMLMFA